MRTPVLLLAVFVIRCVALAAAPATTQPALPTLYIIGDSTVHNSTKPLVGWGDCIGELFDPSKIQVQNDAIAGRSTRTFISDGRWDKVMSTLKPGDFVMMQFGHNDASPINDATRARGTMPGTGDETQEIDNQLTGKHETVHTYGWYLRKFVTDAKGKGATPIICSLVPRDNWKDGKVIRSTDTYVAWAKQIADEEHVPFIDLNDRIAAKYEQMGQEKANAFFPNDHTHTNIDGARLSAQTVVEGIRELKDSPLARYLK